MHTPMSQSPRRISRLQAFTLVELLVVISIVAVLIAILLPSLSKARESARSSVCLSNMRQFLIATHLYIMSAKDLIPGSNNRWLTYGGRPSFYGNGLVAGQYLPNPNSVMCPTMPGTSYYQGYTATLSPWNRNASSTTPWGSHWKDPTSTTSAPMGTYFHFGGLSEGTDSGSNYYWNASNKRSLRTQNVLQPSKYAISSDFDGNRTSNMLTLSIAEYSEMNPHAITRGKSIAWFDGHVTFRPTKNLGAADLQFVSPLLKQQGTSYLFYVNSVLDDIKESNVNDLSQGVNIRKILNVPK